MFNVPLLKQYEDLHCPNCGLSERVLPLPPGQSKYHNCPRLHMLSAPLVPVAMDAKIVAEEREDYLNGEVQATGDNGRPYMAVRTVRADGSDDLLVNAGWAHAELRHG